jgi:hypothetical protein
MSASIILLRNDGAVINTEDGPYRSFNLVQEYIVVCDGDHSVFSP